MRSTLTGLFTRWTRRGPGPGAGEEAAPPMAALVRPFLSTPTGRLAATGPGARDLARELRKIHPGADIRAVPPRTSASQRHAELAATGPFDLIIDLRAAPGGSPGRLTDLVYHLRPGGHLVMKDAGPALAGDPGTWQDLARFLRRAAEARGDDDRPDGTDTDDAGWFATETDPPWERDGHLVVRSAVTPGILAKLNEEEATCYLSLRNDPPGRVLEEIPAQRFRSRCVLRESAADRGINQPEEYAAPAVALREYHDVLVSPGQVVTTEDVVLPDTYRHNQRRRLHNRYVVDVARRFARLPEPVKDAESLTGSYFHLDNELRGHFGHVMTEQISRMWAWPQAKEARPDLKALVTTNRRTKIHEWEYQLYEAAGIPREDVVLLRTPARVETLLSPAPMLSNPQYVHPAIADTWGRIGDQLAAQASDRDYPDRIFCSRRLNKRACNNTAEVEALFAERGFAVVYPEEFPLGDQIEMFRRASVVAGFAGSGVFQLEFVPDPKQVILIASERYVARNEYLMASVLGHEIDQITCRPDDPTSFQSSFTFDHDREGRYLAEVFDRLG